MHNTFDGLEHHLTDNGLGSSLMGDWESSEKDDELASLRRSVRRLRNWVIILVIIMALTLCGPWVLGATAMLSIFSATESELPEPAQVRSQIVESLGSGAKDLKVRTVSTQMGESPFPFSLLEKTPALYVEGTLQPSGVRLSDVLDAGQASLSEFLPTVGPLTDRMSAQTYNNLLTAYHARTNKPLGRVMRYTQTQEFGNAETEVLDFGGRKYPAEHVWAAVAGFKVGDKPVRTTSPEFATREVFVFLENEKTGEFTFLGSERRQNTFEPSYD